MHKYKSYLVYNQRCSGDSISARNETTHFVLFQRPTIQHSVIVAKLCHHLHDTTTGTAPPSERHHITTCTAPPARHHHLNGTTCTTPPARHHLHDTTGTPPVRHAPPVASTGHHYSSTWVVEYEYALVKQNTYYFPIDLILLFLHITIKIEKLQK